MTEESITNKVVLFAVILSNEDHRQGPFCGGHISRLGAAVPFVDKGALLFIPTAQMLRKPALGFVGEINQYCLDPDLRWFLVAVKVAAEMKIVFVNHRLPE